MEACLGLSALARFPGGDTMDSMGNEGQAPATRADVENVRADLGSLLADVQKNLGGRIGGLHAEFKAEVGRLDAKIDSSVRRLAMQIVDVKTELREVKEFVVNDVATKTDIKRLVDAVESFAGKTQTYDAAVALHGQALTDVQMQQKDHERRIKGLEERPH
ncbi:MAG: hypothetical protein ACHQ49_02080 [Elusimicrobiota bacterium]